MMPRLVAQLGAAGARPSRRDWLRLGLPALLGTGGLGRAASPNPAAAGFGRAKSVVVLFTSGGQSQLESFDPKPNAPEEVRGAFGSIPTRVPGLRLCEYLPELAKLADKYAVVKSMTHDDLDHGSACYLALTGQFHPRKSSNPPPRPTDFPALGAVLKRIRPARHFPHTAVHVNGPLMAPREPAAGQYGGFLGRGFEPFEVGNPADADRLLGALNRPADVSAERLAGRRALAGALDTRGTDPDFPRLTRQAVELMNTPAVRTAFDLSAEPDRVQERYGRDRTGRAALTARRLVEAGVPWVTAFLCHGIRGQDKHPDDPDEYGWDTHNDIYHALKTHLLPRFDRTVSAFLDDLDGRGLLKDTLVCVMGEFGRAPLVAKEKTFAGTSPGRKHWAGCYSVVLAGAGVVPGAVVGRSDARAAYPAADPVAPGDLAATLFHALGVPPDAHYDDLNARPYRAVTGDPVVKLFG